jgi:hypothetical protein
MIRPLKSASISAAFFQEHHTCPIISLAGNSIVLR